ncbi:E3 ubiquitin-protein ligase CCNB1IP1-like [Styela clava]
MEGDLFCNVKSCRKRLSSGTAWATSCSHIFCDDDGQKIISKRICTACSKELSGKLDIVRIDTNPSEAYRTMVLVGQRPEVILDVCSRAMSSWSYQNYQEQMHREYLHNKVMEKYSNLKRYCDQMASSWELEAKAMKSQLVNAKSEIESAKKLNVELAEKLREKTRQYQKLLTRYNGKSSLNPQSENRCSPAFGDCGIKDRNKDFFSAFDIPVGGSANHSPRPSTSPFGGQIHPRSSSSTPRFNFKFSHSSTPFIQRETSGISAENIGFQRSLFGWKQDK